MKIINKQGSEMIKNFEYISESIFALQTYRNNFQNSLEACRFV